jgi:hypothetical protein
LRYRSSAALSTAGYPNVRRLGGTTINWEAIGAIGEVVGAIAVFATLLYLARQIRDGARQTRLNTTSNLATLSQDSFAPIYNSDRNQHIWHTGRDDPDKLSQEEFTIFVTYMDRIFYAYQLLVTYYVSGAIEEDLFLTQRTYFQYLFKTPGGQKWWGVTAMQFTHHAKEYLN